MKLLLLLLMASVVGSAPANTTCPEYVVPTSKTCYVPYEKHSYIGTVAVTESGCTCRCWDDVTAHVPDNLDSFPGDAPKNYCRVMNKERPWCFTMDPDKPWEFCDVPKCDWKPTRTIIRDILEMWEPFCVDLPACEKQTIRFEGLMCSHYPSRFIVSFHTTDNRQLNPNFAVRYGYANEKIYLANTCHCWENNECKKWGREERFNKTMDLIAYNKIQTDFILHHDKVEWRMDGEVVGTYIMKDGYTADCLGKVCVMECVGIDTVYMGP